MKLVAFVKGKTHAGEGGMILEMPFEDKHDLSRIFDFARSITQLRDTLLQRLRLSVVVEKR